MNNIISGNLGYKGESGISPTLSVTKENGVATITITDADGTKSVQLSDGEMTKSMVIDNLTSTLTDQPLSANQGKVLKQLCQNMQRNIIVIQNDELSDSTTITPSSDYTKIPCNRTASIIGDKLSKTDDGGVKIGTGVSKVKISAQIELKSFSNSKRCVFGAYKNSNDLFYQVYGETPSTGGTTSFNRYTLNISPYIMSVSENDVIYLHGNIYETGSTADISEDGTYLMVEVVE